MTNKINSTILIFASFLFLYFNSYSQVATTFTFTSANASVGGNLVGGTLLAAGGGIGSTTDDVVFPSQNIGFTFRFNGINYTQIGVSSNGFIWFGTGTPGVNEYNPLSSVAASMVTNIDGVVAVFGQDMTGITATSQIRIQTQGTAPNRTCTINWNRFVASSILNVNQNRMDMWIVLNECSNIIETAISANQYPWTGTTTGEVGLRGINNTDFYNREVTCAAGVTWLNSNAGAANNVTCKLNSCYPGTIGGNPCVYTYTSTTPPLFINGNSNAPYCQNSAITIAITVSGGYPPYDLDWTAVGAASAPASGNVVNASFPYNVIFTPAGTGNCTYSITVTDASGCTVNFTSTVVVNNCAANSITTGVIIGSPFCPCGAVSVPFTSTGTFNAGNIYTAELSDATGSFAAPVSIGTLASTANAGNISAIIPCNAIAGLNYRIRVTSDIPVTVGTDNGINLEIDATVIASVTISASQNIICAGQQVDFNALPVNGGLAPTYQWQVNGGNVGAGGATFSSTTLGNGDQVTCIMTSNANCVSGSPAVSNTEVITVSASVVASVSVFANITTICTGGQVDFTATPTNGGAAPTYQWQVNGVISGASSLSNLLSLTTLNNGDVVTCIMTSNLPCATGSPATSNSVTITVNPIAPAGVSIVANGTTTICSGVQIDFTATPINGGLTPTYQWQVNGTNAGSNSANFSSTTFINGDVVTCIMTSSNICTTGNPATSNSISVTVSASVVASDTITSNPNPVVICSGDPVTFTSVATNGGANPSYQWQINGGNVGANSTTFTSSTLSNGDVVTCTLTSNANCVTGSPDISNSISVTVTTGLVASVSITADNTTICFGDLVNFIAVAVNGGGASIFQWKINGVNAGTNSSAFSTTVLNNGDVVTCIMTSSLSCVTGSPATSNAITMNVTSGAPASILISASSTSICAGDIVDFTATPTNGGAAPTYQWQVNGINVGSSSATYSTNSLADNDVVTCIMTSNSNCVTSNPATSNTITVSVTQITDASITLTADNTSICEGMSATIIATGSNGGTAPVYTWLLNGTIIPNTGTSYTNSFQDGDNITCVLLSSANCVNNNPATSNTIFITVNPSLVITVDPDTITTCWVTPVALNASGANTYSWSPDLHLSCLDCPSPMADPTDTTVYVVTGTSGSCTGTATVLVNIKCPDVFVPSAFTPNGDIFNPVFKVYGLPMTDFTLMVFDRWGQMVFMSHDQNQGWDGTLNGKPFSTGVFVWMFRGKDRDGRNVSLNRTNTGDVTLFK